MLNNKKFEKKNINKESDKSSNDTIEIDEEKNDGKELKETKHNNITYNLDDVELKKINLDKNICIRVINNINGTFIDIRKYYKGYPTKRGIRFTTFMFKKIIEVLKDDI